MSKELNPRTIEAKARWSAEQPDRTDMLAGIEPKPAFVPPAGSDPERDAFAKQCHMVTIATCGAVIPPACNPKRKSLVELETERHADEERERQISRATPAFVEVLKPFTLGGATLEVGDVVPVFPIELRRDPKFGTVSQPIWWHAYGLFHDDRTRARLRYGFIREHAGPATRDPRDSGFKERSAKEKAPKLICNGTTDAFGAMNTSWVESEYARWLGLPKIAESAA